MNKSEAIVKITIAIEGDTSLSYPKVEKILNDFNSDISEINKIDYRTIMNLGFIEEEKEDEIYFDEFGYKWCIIELKLTSKIFLIWEKDTQLCELIRIDNKNDQNIKKRIKVRSLDHLHEIINFFTDK